MGTAHSRHRVRGAGIRSDCEAGRAFTMVRFADAGAGGQLGGHLGIRIHKVAGARSGYEIARSAICVAARRAFTALLNTSSTLSESSQPRHASVMLWPYTSVDGSS